MKTVSKSWIIIFLPIILSSCGPDNSKFEAEASAVAKFPAPASSVEVVSGKRSEYKLTTLANAIRIENRFGNPNPRILTGIKTISFQDINVNLNIVDAAKSIAESQLDSLIDLYVAFFNRLPDADGLEYWIRDLKAGRTINEIAEDFYRVAIQFSSDTGYSSGMSNKEFIQIIYKNVLGRGGDNAPTATEINYWDNDLNSGRATRSSLVNAMLVAAREYKDDPKWGWVTSLLNNKILISKKFAIEQGLVFKTASESIKKTTEIATAITFASNAAALKLIDAITGDNQIITSPVANAGPDQLVQVAAMVTLDGSASTTGGNPNLEYMWSINSAPPGSLSKIDKPTSAKAQFAPDLPGAYLVTLAVKAGALQSSPSMMTVSTLAVNGASYRGQRNYSTWGSGGTVYTSSFDVWEGQKAVLRLKKSISQAEATAVLSNIDACVGKYQKFGQTTWPTIIDPEFPGKAQVAIVPSGTTCGAGCGAGGKAEMTDVTYEMWRGGRPVSDAYAWWVAYYELGRQGGRAFPIFAKLDHYVGGAGVPGERLTSAFPEYIWQRCLADLNFSQDELLNRGPYAAKKYIAGYMASAVDYVTAVSPDTSSTADLPIPGSTPAVVPRNMITGLLIEMHEKFGEVFMSNFFSAVVKLSDATTPRQAACNIVQASKTAAGGASVELTNFFIRWRLPNDCR